MYCIVLQLIKDSFLLAVKDTLGDRYTAHMEVIYDRTIDFILQTLVSGFGREGENSTAGQKADTVKERTGNGYGLVGYYASEPGTSKE